MGGSLGVSLRPVRRRWTVIAETGERFAGFGPYVPAINDAGETAFQATLAGGGSGVFAGSGGRVRDIAVAAEHGLAEVVSHPDIARAGAVCFYARMGDGRRDLIIADAGSITRVAGGCGPLGPSMSSSGLVALRAPLVSGDRGGDPPGDGEELRLAAAGVVSTIARTGEWCRGFDGVPVVNDRGAVVFRADLGAGAGAILIAEGGTSRIVSRTGDEFTELSRFPSMNDDGVVAFCGTLRAGGAGVFAARDGRTERIVDAGPRFESLRGALIGDDGTIAFIGTPRGGRLGVFAGLTAEGEVVSLGGPLLGSTVADLALNPVSINGRGQLAIRARLADSRELILRSDPVGG